MERNTAYSVSIWVAYIAIALAAIGCLVLFILTGKEAIWAISMVTAFILIPLIVFLLALGLAKKWQNVENTILVMLALPSLIFTLATFYMAREVWFMWLTGLVISACSFTILFSRREN